MNDLPKETADLLAKLPKFPADTSKITHQFAETVKWCDVIRSRIRFDRMILCARYEFLLELGCPEFR